MTGGLKPIQAAGGILEMPKRFAVSAIALIAGLVFSPVLRAQSVPPKRAANEVRQQKWNNTPLDKAKYAGKKSAPAPRHDISGIWDGTAEGGIEAKGALEHPALGADDRQDSVSGQPDERNILHPLPYTPLGLEALKANKPAVGIRAVPAALTNDPVDSCEPPGFPRTELFEFRVIELAQTKNQVLLLNQFYDNWRVIWTDGRELPKDSDPPRWNGYSVGKWVDDYTFVAQTVGLDERTWLDNAGRPHSSDLRVEERFHRVDYDTLELTVTLDDPKMYTQPWQALNKFVLHRLPDDFDTEEFICSPSEVAEYNKLVGNPAAAPAQGK
jgi:hypothetical protein